MVVIRLAPAGKKGENMYKVMVADSESRLTGRYLEKLGLYKPDTEKVLDVNRERYDFWLSRGAQPSDRVRKIMKSAATPA